MILPYNHMTFMFWIIFTFTVVAITLISIFHDSTPIVTISLIVWVVVAILYIHEYHSHNKPPKPKGWGELRGSKGTSNADRMGAEYPKTPKESFKKGSANSGVSSVIEVEGKCIRYDTPVDFPEDVDRMLTEDEIEMLEKHYFGLYHSIGVLNGEIQLSPRVNGKASHYTTPVILADYMLDDEE